jgi:hypothetical protein
VNENAQRDLTLEPPGSRPGDIVVQPGSAVLNLRGELANFVAGLSTEQRTELWIRLRSGYLGGIPIGAAYGEELAKLIEPAAPELAQQARSESWTRADYLAFIAILIELLSLALGEIHRDPPPPPPGQTVFIIEHDETRIINLPPPPPIPPTGEPNG